MGINETDPEAYLAPQTGDVNIQGNKVLYFTLSSDFCSFDRVKECGFYYGQSPELNGAERVLVDASSGEFTETVLLKDYESDYYVCSFISNGVDELCSDVGKISIGPLSDYVYFASLATDSYVSSTKKATISVDFDIVAGVEVTSAGICYGITKNLSIDGTFVEASRIGDDFMSGELEGLEAGKQYYARPYIKDGNDIAYAEVSSFSVYAIPEVKTVDVKKITDQSAHLYGNVLADCGKEILERGFVWTEGDTNPTISSDRAEVSGKIGEYDAKIEGLKPNTLYSFRAYAKNSEGTAYGLVENFTTTVAMPSVVTESISDLTSSSVMVRAKVSDDGGEAVSDFGILLDTSPDIDPDKARKVSATGSPSSYRITIDGLSRKTRYYVQAFVTNSAGTAYGEVLEFETLAELPTLTTVLVSNITSASAVSGGNITDDGGDDVTARGVVWGKTQTPTLENDAKSSDGKGVGKYISNITNLRYETVYYVRAYATNSAGTAYGEVVEFTTGAFNIENVTSLATKGTANCYIISESGVFKFPAVKGNSNESVGKVSSVEVLWESFGTSTTPEIGDLIASVAYKDEQIILETAVAYREGNAVVAAKSSDDTILWSWHIWLTDQPEEQVYYNNAGTMMDRNLGATSATPGDVGALGLLYQWGRKDPFLGSSSISDAVEAKSTGTWPSAVETSASKGNVDYVTANPMTFVKGTNSSNYDWHYSSRDNKLWESNKTIYDPCPPSWRVPEGDESGVWNLASGSLLHFNWKYDHNKEGMNFSGKFGYADTIWYPASCPRDSSNGNLDGIIGYSLGYWSNSIYTNMTGAYTFYFNFNDAALFLNFNINVCGSTRASGHSVRCLKIFDNNGESYNI